jgi:hypothetical protein
MSTTPPPRSGAKDAKPEQAKSPPDAAPEFAEEAGPKRTEFGTKRDAKDITAGNFERIP